MNAELLDSTVGEKFCTTSEMMSWNGQARDGLTTGAAYLAPGWLSWTTSLLVSAGISVRVVVDWRCFFVIFPSLRVLDFVDAPMDSCDGMKTRSY